MSWTDPAVWSMVIALVALILSQFPPLRELLGRVRLKIIISESSQLFHNLGNLHLTMFFDAHNIGGRTVIVDRLLCLIADDNNDVLVLPAQTYIPRQPSDSAGGGSVPEFPIGRIVLKPGERWYERTHFYRLLSESEEEQVSEIILKIRDDIASRIPAPPDGSWVEAQPEYVQKAMEFFNHNFKLHKGNYQLLLVALSEDNAPISLRGYEFTLYENHIQILRSYTDKYKYGEGIYFPIQDPMKYLWVRLRLMSDEKQVEKIYNKLKNKI